MRFVYVLATALSVCALPASAALITVSPGSSPVAEGIAFGPVAEVAGESYIDFGIDFSWGGDEGVFSDPPAAWGGVNGSGEVDLLSPVDGRIVVEGTTTQGVTSYFYAEAGISDPGSLTLQLFDLFMNEIASILNGDPQGDNGRTTFSYSGAGIAFFRIFGDDTFGVTQIRLETPVAANIAPIPLPATGLLLLGALAGFGLLRRRT